MIPDLQTRLNDAKVKLEVVDSALDRNLGVLPDDVKKNFQSLASDRFEIDHWISMLDARTAARKLLDGLESKADTEDRVPLGAGRAKFVHVRFIHVQAYITTNWALAEAITGMVGRVLCTPEFGRNENCPAQLVSHFIGQNRNKRTAGALYESLRSAFGWPVGISYTLRNHFIHDGARKDGSDFFAASTSASAFKISKKGWSHIEETAKSKYGVGSLLHRNRETWPISPCDDLRTVLDACERETDDALGVLLGSACSTLHGHVGFMLGEA